MSITRSKQNDPQASLEISLHIGQHVRYREHDGKRVVTGVVRGLSVDTTDDVLYAEIALDEAIVIPPIDAEDREVSIWRTSVPAHELSAFDERDELIADLLRAAKAVAFSNGFDAALPDKMEALRAVIVKCGGAA